MHWITIYDIENSRSVWVAAAISVAIACLGAFLVLETAGMDRSEAGRMTVKARTPAIISLSLATGLAFIASIWWFYDEYRDRWDYASGRYLTVEGQVEEVRVEVRPRSSTVYFQVGKDWFKLPYNHPGNCYPREGEAVELDASETAGLLHQGPPAHAIYKLRLGRDCVGTQPDSREPDRPA